ncbi:hypothetical protein OK016_12065 [Vibrio chagasii]|nr:hypothetical protein [Vibrio chagasii]
MASSLQPFRYIAHNGEINTVRGNLNWMKAREADGIGSYSQAEIDMLPLICQKVALDSSKLDMALELLVLSGRTRHNALMMMIPEAWQNKNRTQLVVRSTSTTNVMEPWMAQLRYVSLMVFK